MSDINSNKYLCYLSLKVLDKYYFIPLEKGQMTESVIFLSIHTVMTNVLAFYLVNEYLT